MTRTEKLNAVKTFLKISDNSSDALLCLYLDFARMEIITWMYSLQSEVPDTVTDVPLKYTATQVMAVIAGFSIMGAEGQTTHSEDGTVRTWKYSDMVDYVRSHVSAIVGVV